MKAALSCLFIAIYLFCLAAGLCSQLLGYRVSETPVAYFFTWDMYSGWNHFEERAHIIAQGESGHYYDLSPPWGELVPFGSANRWSYDFNCIFPASMADNTLRHTDHEPITRIMLVQELWSKKYNLPEDLWGTIHSTPRTPHSYYYVRSAYNSEGAPLANYYSWSDQLAHHMMLDNPRLQSEIARSQPFAPQRSFESRHMVVPASYTLPSGAGLDGR